MQNIPNSLNEARSRYIPWFRYLIVTLLVLGIGFRFYNLDKKNYWNDEVYTSLRISGYTKAEMNEQITNRVIAKSDWQKYQQFTPEKNWGNVMDSLIEDVHPPLYIPLVRFWVQAFGSSVWAIRSLSALLSLLVFPCLYWLCLELFELPTVGWVAMALMAVSPYHVLYAQEGRQYSIWTVISLLSCATLLWAIRQKRKFGWVMYGVTVALGFYTHYFAVFVQLAHGVYIALTEGIRRSKNFTNYLMAGIAGILLDRPNGQLFPRVVQLRRVVRIVVRSVVRFKGAHGIPCGRKNSAKCLNHLASLFVCGPMRTFRWWSRGESNPRPQAITGQFYMRSALI